MTFLKKKRDFNEIEEMRKENDTSSCKTSQKKQNRNKAANVFQSLCTLVKKQNHNAFTFQ